MSSNLKYSIEQEEKIILCSNPDCRNSNIGLKNDNDFENLDGFNPFFIVDIDTVLISSRHMFRAPYSIHEKSGLVSIPIDPDKIDEFKKEDARPENVKIAHPFLEREDVSKAETFVLQAFDETSGNEIEKMEREETNKLMNRSIDMNTYEGGIKKKGKFEIPSQPVKADFFPPCILKIMSGIKEDGRKRALFILINFLKSCGWSVEDIKEFACKKWNEKNYEPLREGYILSQISWHKRQAKSILHPNCENKSYYQDLRWH